MKSLSEYIKENNCRLRQEEIRRLENTHRERARQRKRMDRFRFVIGTLFCCYFPELVDLDAVEVGPQAVLALEQLERILKYMSQHPERVRQILEEAC